MHDSVGLLDSDKKLCSIPARFLFVMILIYSVTLNMSINRISLGPLQDRRYITSDKRYPGPCGDDSSDSTYVNFDIHIQQ